MEKKKMKLWKKILIVLFIILIIVIALIARRTIILSNIDKKVTEYENNNSNIYIKTVFDFDTHKSISERFIKDDVDKLKLIKTDNDGENTQIIQITYPEERKMFTNAKGNKVLYVYKEKAAKRGLHIENDENVTTSYNTIQDFGYSTNILQTIINAFVTSIKSVEIDGKQCYELSSLSNSNIIYEVGKETGLPVKAIQEVNQDGQITKDVITYEYSFGTVTNEDLKEPDINEYKLAK